MIRSPMMKELAATLASDLPGAEGRVATDYAVRLEHVSKCYGTRKVLDDVTFAVPTASAFCLLGRSGTGKSVTLRHIIGLAKPEEGQVLVQGLDISTLKGRALSEVRKRIGFLFQGGALFDSMTVGDNVAFPLRRHTTLGEEEIRRQAKAKLAAVGLEGEIDTMPADLSGGMRKRAGLARAMALDPSILLVDEPSAGLDPITTREIDQLLLERKRQGTTLVVVTHNIPSARLLSDQFGFLHEGRIIARGTVTDLDASRDALVQAFMRSEGGG
jgi:phospholipid/cholesterol/gamma-HCH transport system ATP-binding protein